MTSPVFMHAPPAIAPAARSRLSSLALILAAFVAVGGVAFAVGRWSVDSATPARPGLAAAFAAGGIPEGVDAPVTAAAVTEPSASQGTSSSGVPLVDPAIEPGVPAGVATSGAAGLLTGQGLGAFGGLQGSLTGIEPGSITLAVDGQEQSVALDAATTFLRRTEIEPDALAVGDLVRVSYSSPGGFAGEGPPRDDPPAAVGEPAEGDVPLAGPGGGGEIDLRVAGELTVLAPGSDLDGRPGSTQGTVAAVAEGAIMITLADGQSRLVATDATTAFTRETAIGIEALQLGDTVVAQLPFSRPGVGEAADMDVATPATQVTVLTSGPA